MVELAVTELFFGEQPVRSISLDGAAWFASRDVCTALGVGMLPALTALDTDDRQVLALRHLAAGRSALPVTKGEVWFVSENGVHELARRAHDPDMRREFHRWFTRDVMPSMRRNTGPTIARADLPRSQRLVVRTRKRQTRDVPHALYRFYDEQDRLLYVGISLTLIIRMSSHRATKNWWRDVSRVRVQHYPNRDAATAAEAIAIRGEKPLHNIQHSTA